MASICKFNQYCQCLHELHDSSIVIPIPPPLPMKLNDLWNDPTLLEDVWISPCIGEAPWWLENPDARDGIQALLKHDQCQEEWCRLGQEADNMCQWFGHELAAVELALQQPEHMFSIIAYLMLTKSPHRLSVSFSPSTTERIHSRSPRALAHLPCFSCMLCQPGPNCHSACCEPLKLHWLDPVVLTLADEYQAKEDIRDVAPQGNMADDIFDPEIAIIQDVLAGSVADESDEQDNDDEEWLSMHIEWWITPVRNILLSALMQI